MTPKEKYLMWNNIVCDLNTMRGTLNRDECTELGTACMCRPGVEVLDVAQDKLYEAKEELIRAVFAGEDL